MSEKVIVIGGGHNGLTAAATLARHGRSVVLLEKRSGLGGLAAPFEIADGYRVPGLLHDTDRFRPAVARALELHQHGLQWRETPRTELGLSAKGRGVLLSSNREAMAQELQQHSPSDVQPYHRLMTFLDSIRHIVEDLFDSPPPAPAKRELGEAIKMLKKGWAFRRLGAETMIEVLRIAPMCIADWLNEHFESAHLKALLASPALLGTWMGPWSAGSTTTWLLDELTRGRAVAGGPAALVDSLRRCAEAAGVEIRTGCPVRHLQLENGRVRGVELESGETIETASVLATTDAQTTFLELIRPADLGVEFAERIANVRSRGLVAKVHLALSGPLENTTRPGSFERMRTGEHVDDLERAFDAVKYRQISERPILDVWVPSLEDSSLAPKGHHVVSILAQFAPYDLEGGWTDAARVTLGDRVVDTLAEYAPGLKKRIVARQVLSPADLEGELGLTGGHLYHGEHALDQLAFLRPVFDCAHYRTPIEGLIVGGSSCHPGGGLTGVPGWLAAKAL